MSLIKDVRAFFQAMGTLPWYIQIWAMLYPFPQIVGGLFFIQTMPGLVIFMGRIISFITASQVHKHSPFSKMTGPVGHAHWLLIVPYLIWGLTTQPTEPPLYWFIVYVLVTTAMSAVLDVVEVIRYFQRGHMEFRR